LQRDGRRRRLVVPMAPSGQRRRPQRK